MISHFFDIDSLIRVDNSVWIVSKSKPSIPVVKLSQSEFNLIKKGIYKKYNSPLIINGVKYWLPENLFNDLKIKCKKHKFDITNLSFSMQEFINREVIENLDYKILDEHFQHLKNKTDDIYVICSKSNKKSYESIIQKLEQELEKRGLIVKNYYFISETFYNKNEDDIAYLKGKLLLQHLLGIKTKGDKFTSEEITNYSQITFYDDNLKSIQTTKDINMILEKMLIKTEKDVKLLIKDKIKSDDNLLVIKEFTHNKANKFKEFNIQLQYSNIIKNFESYKVKNK